jgi:hypothetical protein
VGEGEDVPDVQRSAHRRRGRVDGEHQLARGGAVEAVGAVALPRFAPLLLEAVERRARGDVGAGFGLGSLRWRQVLDRIYPPGAAMAVSDYGSLVRLLHRAGAPARHRESAQAIRASSRVGSPPQESATNERSSRSALCNGQ